MGLPFVSALFIVVQFISAEDDVVGYSFDLSEFLEFGSEFVRDYFDVANEWHEIVVEWFTELVCSSFGTEEHDTVDVIGFTFLFSGGIYLGVDLVDDFG